MALATHTEGGFFPTLQALALRIADFAAAQQEAAERRKIYRDTLRELESLSGRDLADLGISRASIRSVAWEAANGA